MVMGISLVINCSAKTLHQLTGIAIVEISSMSYAQERSRKRHFHGRDCSIGDVIVNQQSVEGPLLTCAC